MPRFYESPSEFKPNNSPWPIVWKIGVVGYVVGLLGIIAGLCAIIPRTNNQTIIFIERAKSLLEQQINTAANALQQAEEALSIYRAAHPTPIFISAEFHKTDEKPTAAEQIEQLIRKRNEVADYFSSQHPAVQALDNKIAELQQQQTTAVTPPSPHSNTVDEQLERLIQEVATQRALYINRLTRLQDLELLRISISITPSPIRGPTDLVGPGSWGTFPAKM